MNKHYRHLTQEQRYQIWSLHDSGRSNSYIASHIGVDRSTIGRELKRNRTTAGYQPKEAEKLSQARRRQSAKASKRTDELETIIVEKLRQGWSPLSISERLSLEKQTDAECLSHTSIYRLIAANKVAGGHWHLYLPNAGKTRWKGGKRSQQAGVGLIPDRVDITDRPNEVKTRARLGDWEGDTVYGQSAHLVTLVDRKSRFTLAKRVFDKTKETVGNAMIELLGKVSAKVTLTLDNGGEFADHVRVSKTAKIAIFFAKPYASWQRGSNENTNGRIRRFWPKKFDMGTLNEAEIAARIERLNKTPRKILGGLTPYEVFTGKRVALIG